MLKNILVPIDGSNQSRKSLDFIQENFEKENIQIHILNVKEIVFIDGISLSDEIQIATDNAHSEFAEIKAKYAEYNIESHFRFGYAGDQIIQLADEIDCHIIVMVKSNKKGLAKLLGSCTDYVLKHSKKPVIILPNN